VKRHSYLAALFFLLGFSPSWAIDESVPTYAQLAFPLQNQGLSARAMALGSSFVAVGGDIDSFSWNPAGLAGLARTQLALDHDFYLQDLTRDTVTFAAPGPGGGWGFSLGYLGYGNLQARDAEGNVTGSYGAGRWDAEALWAFSLFPDLSAGLGLKENLLELSGTPYWNTAVDLGILWDAASNLHLGLAWANVGTYVDTFVADSVLRLGADFDWRLSPGEKLLVLGSVSAEPYGVTRLNFGLEGSVGSFLALRGGYQWDLSTTELEGLTSVTAGLGFNFTDFTLDYGYAPFGELGNSSQISLTYAFGSPTPSPAAKASLPSAAPVAAPMPGPTPESEKLKLIFTLPGAQPTPGPQPGDSFTEMAGFQKAISQNPLDDSAWLGLGKLYDKVGRKSEALQCFQQVGRLRPHDALFQQWLKDYTSGQPGTSITPSPVETPE
jgi:hypothetical protein